MAEAAPAAPYESRLKRALDALVYSAPGGAPSDAAADVLGTDDAGPQARCLDACNTEPAGGDAACRPGDRGDYLRRLRSLRPSLWGARPGCAGPVAAARRGWTALDAEPDMLACTACGARLAFPIPPGWSVAQLNQAAVQVAAKLDSAHKASCPWRGVVVPASVAAFPALPRGALAAGFEARAAALAALPRLPALAPAGGAGPAEVCASATAALALPGAPRHALAALDALVASRRAAAVAAASAAADAAAAEPACVAAAAAAAARDVAVLALSGWRLRPSAPPEAAALRCDACGAVAGLWNVAPGRPPPGAPAYAAAAYAARLAALSSPAPPKRANLTALFFSSSPLNKASAAAPAVPALALRTIAGGVSPAATAAAASPGPFGKRAASAAFGSPFVAAKSARTLNDISPPASPAPETPTAGGVAAALAPLAPPASPLPPFSPLGGHRAHCPWVCAWPAALEAVPPADVAPPPGAAPGWLATLDALAPPAPPQPRGGATSPGGAGLVLAPTAEMTPAAARLLVADLLAGRAMRPDSA